MAALAGEVDRLYRTHADEVFRYALGVLRSRPDAEDVVQSTFVRALRALERGERVRAPRNWLVTIAHNECRRFLASRHFDVELPEDIASEPIERGRADELREALDVLAPAQRQALVLRELEGRSYAEIAAKLGRPVSAVETLIFRARRSLREQIENAMSCEEFVVQLTRPDADRTRLRAHARVCEACATLERQERGRKSVLNRLASTFGLPWAFKAAAVAVTVSAVAVTVPQAPSSEPDSAQPKPHPLNLIPQSRTRFRSFEAHKPIAIPHRVQHSRTAAPLNPGRHSRTTAPLTLVRRSRTRVTSFEAPTPPTKVSDTVPVSDTTPPPAAEPPAVPSTPTVTVTAPVELPPLPEPAVELPAPAIPPAAAPVQPELPPVPTPPVNVSLP